MLEVAVHFITATVLFGLRDRLPGFVANAVLVFPFVLTALVAKAGGLPPVRGEPGFPAPLPAREIRATPAPAVLMETYLQG